MHRPTHYSRFYHPNNIGWGVQLLQHITNAVIESSHMKHKFGTEVTSYHPYFLLSHFSISFPKLLKSHQPKFMPTVEVMERI
jgi:hypothetical protein